MKFNINVGQVVGRVEGAWKKALPLLSNEILRDCNEFCKFRDGTLRASSQWASNLDEGKLRWDTVYARRQYWAIPTAYEPGTCWQWCEAAKGAYYQRWSDQANALVRMNL